MNEDQDNKSLSLEAVARAHVRLQSDLIELKQLIRSAFYCLHPVLIKNIKENAKDEDIYFIKRAYDEIRKI